MYRAVAAGALVLLGCTTTKYVGQPPEELPPPTSVCGVQIAIVDARPDMERHPFVGRVNLYPLSRVKPTPWWQLVNETEYVVRSMRDKPERVEIVVTSLRLVYKEEGVLRKHDRAKNGSEESHAETIFLDAYPSGASCAIQATVRFKYAGGVERRVDVACLASRLSTPRVEYWGNGVEESVRAAVQKYGLRLRHGLRLN